MKHFYSQSTNANSPRYTKKSVFTKYMVSGQLPLTGYDKLTLTFNEKNIKTKQTNTNDSNIRNLIKNVRHISFSYNIPNTEIQATQNIEKLTDLSDKEYLLDWVRDVRLLPEICNWSSETSFQVLKTIIERGILARFTTLRTFNTLLDSLLKYSYPLNDRFLYLKQLNVVKQDDFSRITEYLEYIEKIVESYAYCTDLKKEEC
ncbi:hypothetical protein EDEG_01115 [Edhazardia aedis USNM 41457]|uniref:Uncharacterized protein n=1 Tax=Edhazardia aedis (strain USNM 41457) TaxID=1003232 RepID=J9DTS6_EDHAE|nr:hypothetical protein EDEG_01115 [Edhazardia aedis USNM 41457]|eukprot:EJW04702.1 hypothetical protein EDEG_01115 [Edhazardia aedis USNM 41457]